jgi:hypothetical protein
LPASVRLRAWQAAVAVLAIPSALLVVLLLAATPRLLTPGATGDLGYAAVASHVGARAAHRIVELRPGSPLAALGVAPGDRVIDPPRERLDPGARVALEVARDADVRRVEVTVPAQVTGTPAAIATLDVLLPLLAFVLGTLVAVRRAHDASALPLAALFFVAVGGLSPTATADPSLGRALAYYGTVCSVFALPLLAHFVLGYEGPVRSTALRRLATGTAVLAGAAFAWATLFAPYYTGRVVLPPDGWLSAIRTALYAAGCVLAVGSLAAVWRSVDAGRRERLRWLYLAFGMTAVNFVLVAIQGSGVLGPAPAAVLPLQTAGDLLGAASFVTIVYAVLRHRVVDLGFAINRAVVFTAFTGLLLVAFGVVEYLVDHLVRFEARERSAWLDAAVALGLYLAFHRARDAIESVVERVFFHGWHRKEQELERFLETSPHYTSDASLVAAATAAADAFAGGEGAAFYARAPGGHFTRTAASRDGFAARVDVDAPEVVEMKTFRRAVFARGTHGAAVVLPAFVRGELGGFLAVAPKRDGEGFRPDELELLQRLARQVQADRVALRLAAYENDDVRAAEPARVRS